MNKQKINEIRKCPWWEAKAGGSFQLYYYPAIGFTRMKEFYPEIDYWAIVFSNKEKYITQFMREDDTINLNEALFLRFRKDKKDFFKKISDWEKDTREMFFNLEKLFRKEISTWSDKKLFDEFKKFGEVISGVWARALILEGNGIYLEKRTLPKIKREYENFDLKRISELVSPNELSFLSKEKLDLFVIALRFREKKVPSDVYVENLKKDFLEIYDKLKKHQQKYFWIENSYLDSKIISIEEFLLKIKDVLKTKNLSEIRKEIENLTDSEKEKAQKTKLRKNAGFKKDIIEELNFFEVLGDWQDKRKEMNLRSGHYITLFIKEISRRMGIDYKLGYSLLEQEIRDFLINKKNIDFKAIEDRAKLFLFFLFSNGENEIVSDKEEAASYEKLLKKTDLKSYENKISGMVACAGGVKKVSGRAKVIINAKDKDIEKNEILVTSMTRPEFLPFMKKAKAIVTDEGGITSHAAIVSRELNIPCIIGTKIATQVLKDGDEVEVDAEKGVVKILKRK